MEKIALACALLIFVAPARADVLICKIFTLILVI